MAPLGWEREAGAPGGGTGCGRQAPAIIGDRGLVEMKFSATSKVLYTQLALLKVGGSSLREEGAFWGLWLSQRTLSLCILPLQSPRGRAPRLRRKTGREDGHPALECPALSSPARTGKHPQLRRPAPGSRWLQASKYGPAVCSQAGGLDSLHSG